MPVPGPGIQPAHGPIRFVCCLGAAGEVELLQIAFAPGLGEQQLGFVEDQEGAPRCPLKPRAHLFEVGQGFEIKVDDLRGVGQIGEDDVSTFQGEAPDVGDDDAAILERGDGVILNRAGSFVGAVGAVVNFDGHDSPPNDRHEAHAEAGGGSGHDDVERLGHAEEGQPRCDGCQEGCVHATHHGRDAEAVDQLAGDGEADIEQQDEGL
ncbi:hypothetical protein G6F24_014135 [Rhizopus arrhizus]|nr:hypothetical protein G6F24_014135 [Rhizopus arrhizus]